MPKRQNFTSVQLSHHIPTANLKPMRMRTGFELVIPHKTSSVFASKAKKAGRITAIDPQLKLITITYADNTIDVFEYGEIAGDASGKIINHKIKLMPHLGVGSVIKPGDIITYHSEFFNYDPITRQLAWCHGIPTNVAIMAKDVTLEDSSAVSAELAQKMSFESIYARPVTISTDMVIDTFADVGTSVKFNDSLIRLKYEDTENIIGEVDELFDDLKQIEYRSKHDGTIFSIQVFHVAESLNPSITRFINKVTYRNRRKALVTKGTLKEDVHSSVTRVSEGTRVRGTQLSETDVLIIFNIKTTISYGIGDKCVFDSSLKSVNGRIEHQPMMTESGLKIDAIFSANSVFNRIINSPQLTGIMNRVLEQAENEVLEMYFGKDEN